MSNLGEKCDISVGCEAVYLTLDLKYEAGLVPSNF
jgi:hypothetical protein